MLKVRRVFFFKDKKMTDGASTLADQLEGLLSSVITPCLNDPAGTASYVLGTSWDFVRSHPYLCVAGLTCLYLYKRRSENMGSLKAEIDDLRRRLDDESQKSEKNEMEIKVLDNRFNDIGLGMALANHQATSTWRESNGKLNNSENKLLM